MEKIDLKNFLHFKKVLVLYLSEYLYRQKLQFFKLILIKYQNYTNIKNKR